jgi:glutaconate CoA-transferase subunit B
MNKPILDTPYTRREIMAVALSHQIMDGIVCVVGTGLPLIGATLDKMASAPNAVIDCVERR